MEKLIQYCTRESLYDGPFGNGAPWHAAGMGYILITENKHLIVIDGGCPNDAEDFLALLEKSAEGQRPVVDLWIITHPHGDHMGALERICKTPQLLSRVEIKQFIYYFPDEFIDAQGNHPCINANKTMEALLSLTGARCHHPELGEMLSIDGMEFCFLYHPYDCIILNNRANVNLCSLIFTVQAKNKKIMFTGDANTRNMQVVVWLYRKKLKCDILQMPHHALCDTGHLDFYKEVDAKLLLEPTCVAGDRSMHSDQYASNQRRDWNLWAEQNAEAVCKTFEGTVEFEI